MKTQLTAIVIFVFFACLTGCSDAKQPLVPLFVKGGTAHLPGSSNTVSQTKFLLVTSSTLQLGDTSPVAGLAFDLAREELVTLHLSNTLRRVDLKSGELISTFAISPVGLGTTTFNQSASHVIVAKGVRTVSSLDESLKNQRGISIWNTMTGARQARLYQYQLDTEQSSTSSAILPDGATLVSGPPGVIFWDAHTGKDIYGFGSLTPMGEDYGDLTVLTMDQEGRFIAEGYTNGNIQIRELVTKKKGDLVNLDPKDWDYVHRHIIKTPGWRSPSPTGLYEEIWRPLALQFSPERRWLAEAMSGKLLLVDLQHGGEIHFITDMPMLSKVAALAFSPSGRILAYSSESGWQIWDVEAKKLLYEDNSSPIYTLAFSADGKLFAVGNADGRVHLWTISE